MNRFLRRAGVAAGRCRIAFTALILALGTPEAAHAQAPTAVEYFHAGWGQCFVTADPGVIAGLDGGAYGGVWQRTGQTFKVWTSGAGLADVCRFFQSSFAPKSSHFYTAIDYECTGLILNSYVWDYENIAFKVKLPSAHLEQPEAKKVYEDRKIDISTQAKRVEHVVQSLFGGKRIVVFSGGATKGEDSVYDDARAIRDGGGNGSIIGRNTFQRTGQFAAIHPV